MTSDTSRGDLLRPSLGHGRRRRLAPYSTQVGFLSAFFGGPVAGLALAFINARRLGRLPADLVWLLMGAVFYVGLVWWFCSPEGRPWLEQIGQWVGRKPRHLVDTVLGILAFGLASLLHGRAQRQALVMGLDRPKGTWLGIGLIVGGSLVSGVIWTVLLR